MGTAKPRRLRPGHKQCLQQDENLGGRERHWGSGPCNEPSLGLWHGQSWAIVPIWAVVHIWAVVAPRAVVAGSRKPLPPPHSSGSSQGKDARRLSTA